MDMERTTGLTITGCWIIFLIYWFISAFRVKRTAERERLAMGLAYRIPIVIGAILMLGRRIRRDDNPLLIPPTDTIQIIAAAVCVSGLLIAIWARNTLAGNWSSSVTFKQGHELIRAGPYRFVRHPIYTGILAMLLGAAIAIGRLSSWLGLGLMLAGFWIKLKQEERLMMRHFPDQYPAYRREVKALVPWIV